LPMRPVGFNGSHGMVVKFIANDQYLRFEKNSFHTVLYNVTNPMHLGFMKLASEPSTDAYDRNTSIDTAPAVGRLVTGHRYGGGISVYQYHRDQQKLELVWDTGMDFLSFLEQKIDNIFFK